MSLGALALCGSLKRLECTIQLCYFVQLTPLPLYTINNFPLYKLHKNAFCSQLCPYVPYTTLLSMNSTNYTTLQLWTLNNCTIHNTTQFCHSQYHATMSLCTLYYIATRNTIQFWCSFNIRSLQPFRLNNKATLDRIKHWQYIFYTDTLQDTANLYSVPYKSLPLYKLHITATMYTTQQCNYLECTILPLCIPYETAPLYTTQHFNSFHYKALPRCTLHIIRTLHNATQWKPDNTVILYTTQHSN